MRMWIACLVVFLSLGISGTVCVGQGDIDDSIRKVDKLDLVKVEKDLKVVNDGMSKVTEQINKQFNEMMADVLSGTYSKNGYLQQLEKGIFVLLKDHSNTASDANIGKINRIKARAKKRDDKDLLDLSKTILEDMKQLQHSNKEFAAYWSVDKKKVTLNNDIFKSKADEVVSKIIDKPGILDDVINLEENKIEFFLTGVSEKMWPKIKEGKKPFCISTYKIVLRDALIMINADKTFDAEKVLREGFERFKEKDEIKLLYAYVLLINWHDQGVMKKGYEYLEQAYDNLETEKLAYNLVRVGLRLGKVDEGRLYKIIDHVIYRNDTETLGELCNILLCSYLKRGAYDEADTFLDEKSKSTPKLSKQLDPVFKFIVYLKKGKYELIASDVIKHDKGDKVKSLYKSL